MDTRNFTGFPVARVCSRLKHLSRWSRQNPAIRRFAYRLKHGLALRLAVAAVFGLTLGLAYRTIQADAVHPLHELVGVEVRHG